jgi:SAM-dependent methyltransferase
MQRSFASEIMDDPALPEPVLDRTYHELTRAHRWLGNTHAILSALRRSRFPVRRVLDVGCGRGGLLLEIQRRLGADVVGVDLRLPRPPIPSVPIVQADAIREPLPRADVAIAVCLVHHLSDDELVALIRNVGRSARRFIMLDLVRHRLPLTLFRTFVAPFLYYVNGNDGCVSIRRAYTPAELDRVVRAALAGSGSAFRHSVAPLYARQMIDISYA